MARHLLALLSLVTLSACAHRLPTATVARPAAVMAQSGPASGYLAAEFVPTTEVHDLITGMLTRLGFVDPGHMLPPRDPDVLHSTVAFFHEPLSPQNLDDLAARFKDHDVDLAVTGTGVANQQVAYLTIEGLKDARQALQSVNLHGEQDDPHATIGASPANPRDVHGVPKPAQQAVGPFHLQARFHLYMASGGQTQKRW